MRRKGWFFLPLLALLLLPVMAAAQPGAAPPSAIPTRVGTCAFTRIRQVTQRLEDGVTHRGIPGSGSAVTLANACTKSPIRRSERSTARAAETRSGHV